MTAYVSCSNLFICCFDLVGFNRSNLKDLCRHVLPQYAAHWKKIGIFLEIQPGQLEVIQSNNPGDANGCCTDLFIKWLEGVGNVKWENMFEAIDQAAISFSIDSSATLTTTTSK